MRMFRRALVGVLVAAVVCTPNASLGQSASEGKCSPDSSPITGLVKEAHPVVLVHGWTGGPMQSTRTGLERRLPRGWQFLLFDYHDASTQWADSRAIAGCLANYLIGVSQRHRAVDGDGKVFVVAHSMGGLAIRFAAADPRMGGRLGGVVTIATPHGGSPWGNAGIGPVSYGRFQEVFAGLGWTAIPPYTSAARTCLAIHEGRSGMPEGCAVAPYLPDSIPLFEIAGEVTVSRRFFGIEAYELPIGGDSIVPSESALGYLGSAGRPLPGGKIGTASVRCHIRAELLLSAGGAVGGLLADSNALDAVLEGRASLSLVEFLARANLMASCSHKGLPADSTTLDKVASALTDQVQQSATVGRSTLLSAEVPANCKLPRQRLVRGKTQLGSPGGGAMRLQTVAYGDLANLGYHQALSVYQCTAGGVSWPNTIVLIGSGGDLLGSFDLGDIGQNEHAEVEHVTIDHGKATVSWSSYEGAGDIDWVDHVSEVTFDRGGLSVRDLPTSTFVLGDKRFGPIRLGGVISADKAVRVLTPVLGKAVDSSSDGCPLVSTSDGQPPLARSLTWGDLTLFGEYDRIGPADMDSWVLSGPKVPVRVSPPYGVTIGTTYEELRRRVPDLSVDSSRIFNDGDLVTSGSLTWWLDPSNSRVTRIAFRSHWCE